jgi:hypothetical protein
VPELGVLVVGFTDFGVTAVGVLAADFDVGPAQDKDPLLQVPFVALYVPLLLHEAHGLAPVPWVRSNLLPAVHTLHMDVLELNVPVVH